MQSPFTFAYHGRTMRPMARRKINQATANKIKRDYLDVVEGRRPDMTLADVEAKYGIARTTIYALRDKDWNVMATPSHRLNGNTAELSLLQQEQTATRAEVDQLRAEVRQLREVIEAALKRR